jgi:predicted flavoprotein YhiN
VLNFTNYKLNVKGVKGFKQAEATAGGIPLNEVRYQTMESKKQPGLYFAGEILDVDGLIGGYNFQWAWSSGFVAGSAAGKC